MRFLELLQGDTFSHLIPLKATFNVEFALSAENQGDAANADHYVRMAAQSITKGCDTVEHDFFSCSKPGQLIGNLLDSTQAIADYLGSVGADRLRTIVEEEFL